jgi:phage shock protein A
MGFFARLKDIIAASMNVLLDRGEGPERVLNRLVCEMDRAWTKAQSHGAAVIAAERRLAREVARQHQTAQAWKCRARLALTSRRRGEARRFLARHLRHAGIVRNLVAQHETARQSREEVQETLCLLEQQLAAARHHEEALKARHAADQVNRLAAAGAWPDGRSPFHRFALLQSESVDVDDPPGGSSNAVLVGIWILIIASALTLAISCFAQPE